VESGLSVEATAVRLDAPDVPSHDITVSDRGSFTVARCTCGWHSYARRSRNLARREGRDHALLYAGYPAPTQA
jgi:hypothetical protein